MITLNIQCGHKYNIKKLHIISLQLNNIYYLVRIVIE